VELARESVGARKKG